MEFEIEWDMMEVEELYEESLLQARPVIVVGGQERSNWENAVIQGRLLRKQSWRWQGRFAPSVCQPVRRRAWRVVE